MKQQTLTPDELADVRQAVEVMRRGGVIVYPTDTVWGIGCDARNSRAVRRVFELKQRAEAKALITLVDSLPMLDACVDEVPEVAEQLIEAAVDPITIVYDHGCGLAPELLADDGSVGIRLCRHPFAAALCRGLRGPVVSTSANISGAPAPAAFDVIDSAILDGADYVCTSLHTGPCGTAKPSTIIKISAGGLFKFIRP